jgi:hypothetical protein
MFLGEPRAQEQAPAGAGAPDAAVSDAADDGNHATSADAGVAPDAIAPGPATAGSSSSGVATVSTSDAGSRAPAGAESEATMGPMRRSPDFLHGFHWLVALTPGSCARPDANVGATGFCGEALVGFDGAFGTSRWRYTLEAGAGIMPQASQGYPDIGWSQSSGGGYAVLRGMLGYDFTPVFFTHVGAQTRVTYSNNWTAPGVYAVVDLGSRTRLFSGRLEFGTRTFLGEDGIGWGGGPAGGNAETFTVAYGEQFFARYLFQ